MVVRLCLQDIAQLPSHMKATGSESCQMWVSDPEQSLVVQVRRQCVSCHSLAHTDFEATARTWCRCGTRQ